LLNRQQLNKMQNLYISKIILSSLHNSVKHTALIGRNHVLDVDEGIFSTVDLEHFKCLLDEITKVSRLSLTVVNLVAEVLVLDLEQVENWENLTVVGYKCLANGVRASDESLQYLEGDRDNLGVTGVQGDY